MQQPMQSPSYILCCRGVGRTRDGPEGGGGANRCGGRWSIGVSNVGCTMGGGV